MRPETTFGDSTVIHRTIAKQGISFKSQAIHQDSLVAKGFGPLELNWKAKESFVVIVVVGFVFV